MSSFPEPSDAARPYPKTRLIALASSLRKDDGLCNTQSSLRAMQGYSHYTGRHYYHSITLTKQTQLEKKTFDLTGHLRPTERAIAQVSQLQTAGTKPVHKELQLIERLYRSL